MRAAGTAAQARTHACVTVARAAGEQGFVRMRQLPWRRSSTAAAPSCDGGAAASRTRRLTPPVLRKHTAATQHTGIARVRSSRAARAHLVLPYHVSYDGP
jgi:hypothetical protein